MNAQDLNLNPGHQEFVDRFTKACLTDDRVVAAFLGGSYAQGRADKYSDVDVCLITTQESYEEFVRHRQDFLGQLGDLVFLEDFEIPDIAFYIYADGTEGELNFVSEGQLDRIHSGAFRILVDKKNILAGAVFPESESVPSEQTEKLRRLIYWFWHDLSHFVTAMGRGQLWWAQGQLEVIRSICVALARLENDFTDQEVEEEVYSKIENVMPVERLFILKETICPIEKGPLLRSAHIIVKFYKDLAVPLAQKYGIPYPHALERVMIERLEKLTETDE
jgi:predicted nucleotidyltransferase